MERDRLSGTRDSETCREANASAARRETRPPYIACRYSASIAVVIGLTCAPVSFAQTQQKPAPVPPDHAAKMAQGLALFKERVRPLLIAQCLDCHGGKAKKADFDLSDRKTLIDSGVIDGGGKACQLYKLITHAEEPHMPSKKPKLADADIENIARWIDLGAPYDKPLTDSTAPTRTAAPRTAQAIEEARNYWAFRGLERPSTPPVSTKNASWVRTPVDRFILAKLESKGIAPNQAAERRTLIRRVSFDLIGLPPTPEEVDAFVADDRADAYDQLVDRLLASPHYGERWARHWMDVARFAESHGYEQDYDRPFAYHYRDFLIKALNRDMPFDQFVRWQLAGDELAPDDPLAMAATGFLGAGAFPTQLTEAEFESARYNELDDMVATTGTAMLGLTIGCARCHDHKYDPILSEDYYRLASVFTTAIRSEVELVMQPGKKPTKVQVTSEGLPHTKHHADERGFPHFYPKTYVLSRGDVNQKQREAIAGYLHVLERAGHKDQDWTVTPPGGWTRTSMRRAALASWMTDTEGGAGSLAARVIVNRLWQHHFGRGIVATPSDFGEQGEAPSHPELLEWLAADLVHHGWTFKRVHRLIVTSAVYVQDNRADEAREKIDRENVFLWRYTPRRLEAEPIRDNLLAVSGRLDTRMFGPGTLDPNMRRRSVYFFIKRSQLIPTMMLFDWPEHLVSIGQRASTTTAPQALLFMNSALGRASAEGLASRVIGEPGTEGPLRRAYKLCFGREPGRQEMRLGLDFMARQHSTYAADNKSDPARRALLDLCQALLSMSETIYIN
jgi:mono/diheme cytochrome c family protein